MEFLNTLNREDMKNIMAGSTGCRIFFRTSFGDEWWSNGCYSIDDAQDEYQNNATIDAYCCASCGQEGTAFANADPCNGVDTIDDVHIGGPL